MTSFNRVILVGRATREIEVRYTQIDTPVTDVGLAINHRRKDQTGQWGEETTFVDVTLWGRTAEAAAKYVSKGSPLLIEGRLQLDTWEVAGHKRSKLKVIGERMQILSPAPGNSANAHPSDAAASSDDGNDD